jgi:hypothetical protein
VAVETLLGISGPGISPYSARGLSQTLEPIDAAKNMRRTINGTLLDVSAEQFRKYRSTISCNDQNTPALDGIWPGMTLTVDCVATLSYKTGGGAPSRSVVPGSSYAQGTFTIYRPRLTMIVSNYSVQEDEYGAAVSWSLDLEEV